MKMKHRHQEVRIDPELVDRRIRMLNAHIAIPTLRPTRRKKMRAELESLLRIQTAYNEAMARKKKEIIDLINQTKLEQVAPELAPVAKEATEVHELLQQGVRPAMIGMLPGTGAPTAETLEEIAKTEEKKE